MRAAAVVAGCALLVARPALLRSGPPALVISVLFTALLLAALVAPSATDPQRLSLPVVLVVGVAAFGLGRLVGGTHAPVPFTARLVGLNSLAAVAEEAFFRKLVYGALAPVGAAFAIGATATLVALVHLTIYGAWVLPIDAAAGLLFGWQRWASGRWSVPAATHVVANILVVV